MPAPCEQLHRLDLLKAGGGLQARDPLRLGIRKQT